MIGLVTARRQHEVQQLESVRLQQTGAARLVQGKAERTDADHIEQLGMRQGHDDLQGLIRSYNSDKAETGPHRSVARCFVGHDAQHGVCFFWRLEAGGG